MRNRQVSGDLARITKGPGHAEAAVQFDAIHYAAECDEVNSLMDDAPLKGLDGQVPHAPEWFARSLAAPCESGWVNCEGADIEYRAWGDRGKPGLLLWHGNGAHLGWWSFLAPFFSDDYRVVASNFSGMGGSNWRDNGYSAAQFAREGFAAAEVAGACAAGPPVVVGHSLGGYPVLEATALMPERLRAGILVDVGLPGADMIRVSPKTKFRVYPTLSAALDRFRLSPPQPCHNTYLADYVARMNLREEPDGGWTWRFDPRLWNGIETGDLWAQLGAPRVPLAVIRGEHSVLTGGETGRRVRDTVPAGTPLVTIPEAWHHVAIDQPLALVAAVRALLTGWS